MPNEKNILSQLGWEGASDADYAEEFGIDPSDPQFNMKMLDHVENMNYQSYIAAGIPDAQAKHKAKERKAMAVRELPKHVKL